MTDLATELRRMIASMAANRRASLAANTDLSHLAFLGFDPSEPGTDKTVIHWFMPRQAGKTDRQLGAAALARFSDGLIDHLVNPPLFQQQVGRIKRPRTAKAHRHAIAAKCSAIEYPYNGNKTDVFVTYRGHEAVYDMAGDRPRFMSRNFLSKPEEPAKIVQDGMRLAAVWHVHPERRPKPPTILGMAKLRPYQQAVVDILNQRNPMLDALRISPHPVQWHHHYSGVPDDKTHHVDTRDPGRWLVQPGDTLTSIAHRYYGDGLLWTLIYGANKGVIGKDPGRIVPGQELTLPAYWKAKPAPSVDELTFEQAALRHAKTSVLGAMPSPDSFVITPELSAVLGHRNMGEYLAIWAAMTDAARWKK